MHFRRHPHLARPARADETDPLDLLGSLPPADAQEAERMFRAEHKSEQRASAQTPVAGIAAVADAHVTRAHARGRRRDPEAA